MLVCRLMQVVRDLQAEFLPFLHRRAEAGAAEEDRAALERTI